MLTDIFYACKNFYTIKKKEFYSREKLKDYQWRRLKETLNFSYNFIPYYQETYRKAGIHLQDIQTWKDFERLPFLTKQIKRAISPDEFLPRTINKKKIWKTQTTGSSGIPIMVYRDSQSSSWDRALNHYCFSVVGIRFYHRFCQIVAAHSEKPHTPGPLAKFGLKRNFTVNLKQTDAEIVRQIQEIKPNVLWSFPSVFLKLAEFIRERNIRLNLHALIAQGEVLPEIWRSTIENAFEAPLYHTYGATELARIGFECAEQEGYHLITDAAVVEIIENEKAASFHEEGELIVTNLNNYCSPLIRYQIGDRGSLSPFRCRCGINYPLLKNITGRSDDFMILPSGARISARAVTHLQFEGIIQYKIVQKSPSVLKVLIIPSSSFGIHTIRETEKVLRAALLNEPVEIKIIRMESLPVTQTGKLQLVTREF